MSASSMCIHKQCEVVQVIHIILVISVSVKENKMIIITYQLNHSRYPIPKEKDKLYTVYLFKI